MSPERLLHRKIAQMHRVLWLERLWPRLWLPVGVAGAFVLVSLLGLWPLLTHKMHLALLWVFAIGFVASLVPVLRMSPPTREEAMRRLEERSGVPHRPASAIEDQPAGDTSPTARTLWQAYRWRVAAAINKLKPGAPHPRTDKFDPFALRALLMLLLIVALTAQWGEVRTRIATAFELSTPKAAAPLRVDAWIAPPVYTNKPPVTLASGTVSLSDKPGTQAWEAPEGSELTIRVNNASPQDLRLSIEADGVSEQLDFKATSGESARQVASLQKELAWSQHVTLRHQGRVVASWPITVTADDTPRIRFSEEPSATQRKAVQLDYEAEDDYGLASATATFRLLDDKGEPRLRDGPWPAPEVSLPVSGANSKSVKGQIFKDLTAHPWAGLPVEIVLKAQDLAGQNGYSKPHRFVLPEREFTKPLARAVIEQRRKLVAQPRQVRDVVRILNALTIAPEKFFEDRVVYLGLRTAYWRLVHDTGIASVKSVVDQLWRVALRIEDGGLAEAEERLRQAQERLREALDGDASSEEIEKLTQELRTALSEFLRQLAERAQRDPGEMAQMPQPDPEQMLSTQDLDKMLDDIEDLAKTGSRELAQQMLSQLRSMLESLRSGRPRQSEKAGQMMEMLKQFSEIVKEQQELLDETYEARRQNPGPGQQQPGRDGQTRKPGPGREGESRLGQLGGQQEQLRETLRRLMEKMRRSGAKMPGELDGAGDAMDRAGDALRKNEGERATQQQTLALDRLRKGAQSMAEQILQQLGQQRTGQVRPGMRGRDPLGRPQRDRGADPGDSVEIPEKFAIERAREILQELRRRLGNPSRPSVELEYLERLIERF